MVTVDLETPGAEEELSLESGGLGAFPDPDTVANGGNGVVDPHPTLDVKQRGKTEGVHDGGVAVVETRYVDDVEFPDGAIDALLASGGEVGVS